MKVRLVHNAGSEHDLVFECDAIEIRPEYVVLLRATGTVRNREPEYETLDTILEVKTSGSRYWQYRDLKDKKRTVWYHHMYIVDEESTARRLAAIHFDLFGGVEA